MAIDLKATFAAGGRPMIDLLEYCVFSVQMDPIFCCLASDYRMLPTATKAITLYEAFCSPTAPARISPKNFLPPYDKRIARDIDLLRPPPQAVLKPDEEEETIKTEEGALKSDEDTKEEAHDVEPPIQLLPAKFLFDTIAGELERSSAAMLQIATNYNPSLLPQQNLPGGQLASAQRQFVNGIWVPQVRPFLVSAGFFKIANIA
jgi:hypothetical protein